MTPDLSIVHGMSLTPPIIGRILTGHLQINEDGSEEPVQDGHFTLATFEQDKQSRAWQPHPLQAKLSQAQEKLTSIPVRIAYNNPNLTLHNRFTAYDALSGRVLCVGDGQVAQREAEGSVTQVPCPGSASCYYGAAHQCCNLSRAYFQIDGQEDALGVFLYRTASVNGLNKLASRLRLLSSMTGGKLAGLPMQLVLITKATKASDWKPIHHVDLIERPGQRLIDAIQEARAYQEEFEEAGLSLEDMEKTLLAGRTSGIGTSLDDPDDWTAGPLEGAPAQPSQVDRRPPAPTIAMPGLAALSTRLRSESAPAPQRPTEPASEASASLALAGEG